MLSSSLGSPAAVTSQPLLPHRLLPLHSCPTGRETGGKLSGRNVKKLSVPSLLEGWDSLTAFYFLHSVRVK